MSLIRTKLQNDIQNLKWSLYRTVSTPSKYSKNKKKAISFLTNKYESWGYDFFIVQAIEEFELRIDDYYNKFYMY